VEIFPRFAD